MRKGSYWNSNRLSSSQQSAAIECFQEDDRCRGKMLFCTILICYRSQLIGMMEWQEKAAGMEGRTIKAFALLWMSLETDHDKAYARMSLLLMVTEDLLLRSWNSLRPMLLLQNGFLNCISVCIMCLCLLLTSGRAFPRKDCYERVRLLKKVLSKSVEPR